MGVHRACPGPAVEVGARTRGVGGQVPVPFLVVQFGRCAELLDAGGMWRLKLGMPRSHHTKSKWGCVRPERCMIW